MLYTGNPVRSLRQPDPGPGTPSRLHGSPADPDENGTYGDLNAGGRPDFADVVLYFDCTGRRMAVNGPVAASGLNGNGWIGFTDIVMLLCEM